MTSHELTHFKKMLRVWKTKSLLFCLRYDPLIVFRRQNHLHKKRCHITSLCNWPIAYSKVSPSADVLRGSSQLKERELTLKYTSTKRLEAIYWQVRLLFTLTMYFWSSLQHIVTLITTKKTVVVVVAVSHYAFWSMPMSRASGSPLLRPS